MVHLGRDRPAWLVDDFSHAGQCDVLALSDENDLVLGLAPQIPGEMQVLPGEVLMHAQNFHGKADPHESLDLSLTLGIHFSASLPFALSRYPRPVEEGNSSL